MFFLFLRSVPLSLTLGLLTSQLTHAASSNMEALGQVSNGCAFGTVTPGVLGLKPDRSELSTEIGDGSRPSVVLHIVGTGGLQSSTNPVWSRSGTSLSGITTTSVFMNAPGAGSTQYILPSAFSSPGSHTIYWRISGQSNTAFGPAGVYKVATTLTCY